METSSIIKRVLNTEKTTRARQAENKYFFEVDRRANKTEVKKAVEKLYRVKVVDVNTAIMHGKKRRVRWQLGITPDWKKAIVRLKIGDRIEILE